MVKKHISRTAKGVNIFTRLKPWGYNILVLAIISVSSACDPCRQLAEKMCQCRETEDEKRQCMSELSLANQHEYFEAAKDAAVCESALKQCSCEKLNNNNDAECGMYRRTAQ